MPTAGVPANPGPTRSGRPLSIEASSVEFRPEDHPEDAAVLYRLHLVNTGPVPIVVGMDQDEIRGTDDQGNEFEDFWSQAERNNADGCACTSCRLPNFARLTNLTVPLGPGGSRDVDLYLNPVGASGDCQRSGRARSRVGPGTTSITLTLPDISLRPGDSVPLSGVELELEP